MLASATRAVAPSTRVATRHGAGGASARAVVRSITRPSLARSLRSFPSRAGTATTCVQDLVALPSKAVRCPLPAASTRSLPPCAGRSARAATAAPRRCSASAAPRRNACRRRAHRAGWRSAIPSTLRSSSMSSAGPAATSARPRCPPDATADDHAHPPPRRRAADVEIERRRPHPAGPARRAGAAPAGPGARLARDASVVAVRPPRRDALSRGPTFSDAVPDASQ